MKTARFSQANNLLKEIQVNTETAANKPVEANRKNAADTTKKDQSLLDLINKDTTKVEATASTREGFTQQNPLFGILIPRVTQQGQPLPSSMVGLASWKDTAQVD
jgi:SecD/SecF fusion protein